MSLKCLISFALLHLHFLFIKIPEITLQWNEGETYSWRFYFVHNEHWSLPHGWILRCRIRLWARRSLQRVSPWLLAVREGRFSHSEDTWGVSLWYVRSDATGDVLSGKRFSSVVTFKKSLPKRSSRRVTEDCPLEKGLPTSVTLTALLPVWILWCWVRDELRLKAFPHSLHL